jgi:hypothetical protein
MKPNTHFGSDSLLVLGAEWIIVMVLAGFFGLLGLLFTASVAAEHAVSGAIAPAMATIAAVSMALLTWLAVGQLANTQQRLAARLAPSHGGRRAGRGTLTGLLLAWLVCTVPTGLLFAALQQADAALALVSGTALVLSTVAAAACAWHGRLPRLASLPALIVLVALLARGVFSLGSAWLQVPWGLQVLALALGLALLMGMLQSTARAASSPAQQFARWNENRLATWRARYQQIRAPGETSNAWLVMIPAYQFQNWKWLGWEQDGASFPCLLLFVFLIAAFYCLHSIDLHPRFLLAPGRARRNRVALRIVATTLRLTLSIGLLLAAIPIFLISAWEGGLSLALLERALSIISVLVPIWVLAVVTATWLRGLEGPTWTPWVVGGAVLAVAVGALLSLTWGLGLNQGTAVLCVALLGCALLLPLGQRAWQHKDLSRFSPSLHARRSEDGFA